MPQITLDITPENGLRIADAFDAHRLSPLVDPETGQPYGELIRLKKGLIALITREVHAFERGQVMKIAHATLAEAKESVVVDPNIVS